MEVDKPHDGLPLLRYDIFDLRWGRTETTWGEGGRCGPDSYTPGGLPSMC